MKTKSKWVGFRVRPGGVAQGGRNFLPLLALTFLLSCGGDEPKPEMGCATAAHKVTQEQYFKCVTKREFDEMDSTFVDYARYRSWSWTKVDDCGECAP